MIEPPMEQTVESPSALACEEPAAVLTVSAGERVQLTLAGGLWAAAALVLAWRGTGWLIDVNWWPALVFGGLLAGCLKARFLLDGVAKSVALRIRARGPQAAIAGFLSVRSWSVVVLMIAGGHALRLTATPRPLLGVVYVAIATALAIASRLYWRVLSAGWGVLAQAPGRQ